MPNDYWTRFPELFDNSQKESNLTLPSYEQRLQRDGECLGDLLHIGEIMNDFLFGRARYRDHRASVIVHSWS